MTNPREEQPQLGQTVLVFKRSYEFPLKIISGVVSGKITKQTLEGEEHSSVIRFYDPTGTSHDWPVNHQEYILAASSDQMIERISAFFAERIRVEVKNLAAEQEVALPKEVPVFEASPNH